MSIRVAGPADLTKLLELEHACIEAPHWSEEVWRSLLRNDGDEGKWHAVLIAENDQTVVGFLVLAGNGEVSDLESIAVSPEFRSRGVGRSLCNSATKLAVIHGAKRMELEVRSASLAPRQLYDSLGFIEQGIRRSYYRNPPDDAVLMSLPLLGNEFQA